MNGGAEDLRAFRAARLTVSMLATEPVLLPPFQGSTIRGAVGHALKSAACLVRRQTAANPQGGDCGSCPVACGCPYSYIFETPSLSGPRAASPTRDPIPPASPHTTRVEWYAGYERVPHPFVLEPPAASLESGVCVSPGGRVRFGLVLLGRALDYLPYFLVALVVLARSGIGKGRGRLRLERVCDERDQTVFEAGGRSVAPSVHTARFSDLEERTAAMLAHLGAEGTGQVCLKFISMTRLKSEGRLQDKPDFDTVVRAVVRRVGAVLFYHHDVKPQTDFRALIDLAREVRMVRHDTRWVDWERFSSRQQVRMKMGGIVGEAIYDAPTSVWRWVLPWLLAAEYTHVGKNVTFGLGQVAVSANVPRAVAVSTSLV